MLSFKQFVGEEKVNYNPSIQLWQVRSDNPSHTIKHQKERVVISGAKPYVDHAAHNEGKRVYAYLQGKVERAEPDLSNHKAHPVKFQPGNTDAPFVHSADNSSVKHAEYVVFHKNKVTAYYKK